MTGRSVTNFHHSGVAGVVLAGGSGTRVGANVNKVYLPLAGSTVISWSLKAFARVTEIDILVLVVRPEDAGFVDDVVRNEVDMPIEVVFGGATRQASELAALRHLAARIDDKTIDTVLLHDGARPLITAELIATVINAAREHGGAVPGLAADDLVEVTPESGSLPRISVFSLDNSANTTMVRVQTPQGFRADVLLDAYERAAAENFVGTDTASCVERFSEVKTQWVSGTRENFKITYPHDLAIAERMLSAIA